MRMAQEGDDTAYASLLRELADYITSALRRQFGAFPFTEDCVQETLIAVHSARHTYQPDKPFKPWLNAIIKHKTIDLLRKNQRHMQNVDFDIRPNTDIDEDGSPPDWPGGSDGHGGERGIEDYLAGAQLLHQLEKPNRDALVYTKFFGFSVEDTATKLNTSPAAVKQRVKRAIAKTNRIMAASL